MPQKPNTKSKKPMLFSLVFAACFNDERAYPFGMLMMGRQKTPEDYRYGFNGMEKDDETKGDGNSYTTEFRQYDPRLGRWLSIDPEFQNFPWQSPYVAFDNNPILLKDPKGRAAKNENGEKRAEKAQEKVKTDKRTYGKGSDKVDCSQAAQEISNEVKDDAFKGIKYDEKFSPSLAANQANHLEQNGEFTTNVEDVQVGDYIFWTGSKSGTQLKNIDHVGVVTKIENGTIYVASAEVATAEYNKETKTWEGGKKSFKEAKLSDTGKIWQKKDGTGGKTFVGAGRPKQTTNP